MEGGSDVRCNGGVLDEATYYSVGGGFVVQESERVALPDPVLLYPCDTTAELQNHCRRNALSVHQMVWENGHAWRTSEAILSGLRQIWSAMLECAYRGAHTEALGGSVSQVLMAAEIAMEHHLALEGRPEDARVNLDEVIATMWQTALDMNEKYKETSLGGLAANIAVNVSEC